MQDGHTQNHLSQIPYWPMGDDPEMTGRLWEHIRRSKNGICRVRQMANKWKGNTHYYPSQGIQPRNQARNTANFIHRKHAADTMKNSSTQLILSQLEDGIIRGSSWVSGRQVRDKRETGEFLNRHSQGQENDELETGHEEGCIKVATDMKRSRRATGGGQGRVGSKCETTM